MSEQQSSTQVGIIVVAHADWLCHAAHGGFILGT